jgi:nickel-dependent lactate racemase
MPIEVPYGINSTLTLDLPAEAVIGARDSNRAQGVQDIRAATAAALAAPLRFPPLIESVLPGDRVTVAIDPDVPQAEVIVAAVVDCLRSAGVAARDIALLYATEASHAGNGESAAIHNLLPAGTRGEVLVIHHDPSKRAELSYLAATERGRGVYLHRAICDADFVIPVACARSASALGCHAAGSTLYPLFSDETTRRRYRSPRLLEEHAEVDEQARREIDEVTWLLGTQWGIQVVPGSSSSVLEIVAGEIGAAFERARELHDAAWHKDLPSRPSLVVATIEGDSCEQSWPNVARALASAANIVAENGAIALCCDLATAPGPAIQALAHSDDRQRALYEIRKERSIDASAALLLAKALTRARVYLLSRLDEGVVEALDVAAVDAPEDIARLVARHESCVVLAGAQHATARAAENEALR